MAMNISNGQEMKISISSVDPGINTRKKTIRYFDPKAAKSIDANLTALTRDLMANSQNTYKYTEGTIDFGILSES